MIKIEKIANGYLVIFKNTEKLIIKLFFPNLDELNKWMKVQFEREQ